MVSQLAAVRRVTQKLNSWFGWSVGQKSSERKSFMPRLPRGAAEPAIDPRRQQVEVGEVGEAVPERGTVQETAAAR